MAPTAAPTPGNPEGMVLIMGITGSGKSYFVNKLKEGSTVVGDSLESCTQDPQIVETYIGDTSVAVVDCPGFDDSENSDTEILNRISKLLTAQYHIKMKLWGVVFLQPISDVRYKGSAKDVFSVFRQLVGDENLGNVVLATTQWSKVQDQDIPLAESREQQFRDKYWRDMIEKDSMTTRFEGTKASAEGIIAQLVRRDNVVLQLQKELVDQKKSLGKTAAGSLLKPGVDRKLKDSKEQIKRLRAELTANPPPNNTRKLRILRELREAEENIAKNESDEAKLGKQVGVDLIAKLKNVDWHRGLRLVVSVLGFAVTVVSVVLGGSL